VLDEVQIPSLEGAIDGEGLPFVKYRDIMP